MSYPGMRDLKLKEETLFERSRPGRCGYSLPKEELVKADSVIPSELLRKNLDLPELSEVDVARHYTRLSTYNFSIDHGLDRKSVV